MARGEPPQDRVLTLYTTGVPTVSLSADIETPLIQITVPEKIETNIKDAKESETQVIKKPDFWKMMGVLFVLYFWLTSTNSYIGLLKFCFCLI